MKLILVAMLLVVIITPAFAESLITFDVDTTKFTPGAVSYTHLTLPTIA